MRATFVIAGLAAGWIGLLPSEAAEVPVPMVWQFNAGSLKGRQYLKDIDFIKQNTLVDVLAVAPVGQVNPEDPDQFHDAFKELVEYAKAKGKGVRYLEETVVRRP